MNTRYVLYLFLEGQTLGLPFLCALRNIFHRDTLSSIGCEVITVRRNLDYANKSVMDQNPLRTVLAGAFRFIHINVVDKFPQKWCSQRIHFHELSNRMDELIFPLCRKIQVIDFIAYSMNPVCKFHALYFGF